MRSSRVGLLIVLALGLTAAGCARYQRKPLAFMPAASYPNHQEVDGALFGVRMVRDSTQAREAFGFDILDAGVLPVQVVIENGSQQSLRVVADQCFLIMPDGQMYPLLRADLARERIAKKTSWGEVGPRAGRGALLGAAGGALVGVALGVVSSRGTLSSAGKGAVIGAAGGAVVGGAEGATDEDVSRAIARDLRDAALENQSVEPNSLGHGILFFPAEAIGARQMRLRVRQMPSGKTFDLTFAL